MLTKHLATSEGICFPLGISTITKIGYVNHELHFIFGILTLTANQSDYKIIRKQSILRNDDYLTCDNYAPTCS